MKSCLILPHNAGLFSLLNNVITCLQMYDRVAVQWGATIYKTGPGEDSNLWNHLFEPLPPLTGDYDVLDNYPNQWMTYKHAAHLYATDRPWRDQCSELWQKLFVRQDILEESFRFMEERGLQDFISVMVRAHTHAGEQVSEKSQRLDDYAAAIQRASGPATTVFLMAGDLHTVGWLKARFPVIYFEDTPRLDRRDYDRHLNYPQTVADARRVLVEVLVASAARALIHPVSNMATAALYMNPEIQSIYLP